MTVSIEIGTSDHREEKPQSTSGVFYIYKVKMIAQFSFGESGSFADAAGAIKAMNEYLRKRKDVDQLNVTLIER